jgi:hypothetical protein
MPGISGLEAAKAIRQIPSLADVAIIIMSASTLDLKQKKTIGYEAFLKKPIDMTMLMSLLEEHLDLEWEYAKVTPDVVSYESSQVIVPPPPKELSVLYDLALWGDMKLIRERARYIESLGIQYVPFARKLKNLAQSFQERAIIELIKEYMKDE